MMAHQNEQICSSNTENWAAPGLTVLYIEDYTLKLKSIDEPE
jgi:hypothetical protein